MTGFETRAIHAGQPADPETGAVMVPIYQSSTFAQEGVGRHKGYEYARTGNPTRSALEACLASLEGAAFGFCFASGMAAEDAILMVIVTVGDDPGSATANLLAPIVVNQHTRQAAQIVVAEGELPLRAPLFAP